MSDEKKSTASRHYAFGRLQRALLTAQHHPDEAVRGRARAKAETWHGIIEGMTSGALTIGSRTPVESTPAWVTLEVAHGGFATGLYVAESDLLDHERALLASLPSDAPGATPRERLNLHFLTDEGQRELVARVSNGTYRVGVPEEGALAAVAWLFHLGRDTEALELVATLRPLLHRLRFYPEPLDAPRAEGALVHVATAGEIAARLWDTTVQPQVHAMNESLRVWTPLYDRLVALWADTVDGELPTLERAADGSLARRDDGQPRIVGGWPCKRCPSDWSERRELWLADYEAAKREHALSRRFSSPKSNFAILRDALERCPTDTRALTGRDVGRIRRTLAGTTTRRGGPGSEARSSLRAAQTSIAERPTHAAIACVLAARLDRFPPRGGLSSLAPIEVDVQAGESAHVPGGVEIPQRFVAKAARALEAPLDELLARGIIGSSETLALVLPQITAGVLAAGISEPASRGLHAQIYAAFRKRRSLLLLNLEDQVQLEELPWVAALAPLRRGGVQAREPAREALREVTRAALFSFPHTIVPNRLVRELDALAREAKLDLPLVEEVAADIFMGTFSVKWSEAAERATALLRGTLYARYYGLPEWRVGNVTTQWRTRVDEGFTALCRTRAAEAGTGRSYTATNGAILEQSQILTTHNLAVLVDALDLTEAVRGRAPELAERVLRWVVRRHVQVAPDYVNRLRMLKNTAYGWRQAIYFLSLTDIATQRRVVGALDLSPLAAEHRGRFEIAVAGLRHAIEGGAFDEMGHAPGARRFLGWACGAHWLMPGSRSGG